MGRAAHDACEALYRACRVEPGMTPGEATTYTALLADLRAIGPSPAMLPCAS